MCRQSLGSSMSGPLLSLPRRVGKLVYRRGWKDSRGMYIRCIPGRKGTRSTRLLRKEAFDDGLYEPTRARLVMGPVEAARAAR